MPLSQHVFKLTFCLSVRRRPGGGGTPYNGLYGDAPPERGTLFKLAADKRVGISRVGVWKRDGKTDF